MAEEINLETYTQYINGNIEAFDKIVLKYKNNLISFILRYVKDYYVAEDISQDVFAYIYVYRKNYNLKYSFKTYLFTIAKNKSIDYLRKKKDLINISDVQIQDTKNIEDELLIKESDKETINLLKKLRKDQEIVLYLADIEQLPYKEIAKITKKTVSNVKVTVFRARNSLKEIIGKREE